MIHPRRLSRRWWPTAARRPGRRVAYTVTQADHAVPLRLSGSGGTDSHTVPGTGGARPGLSRSESRVRVCHVARSQACHHSTSHVLVHRAAAATVTVTVVATARSVRVSHAAGAAPRRGRRSRGRRLAPAPGGPGGMKSATWAREIHSEPAFKSSRRPQPDSDTGTATVARHAAGRPGLAEAASGRRPRVRDRRHQWLSGSPGAAARWQACRH